MIELCLKFSLWVFIELINYNSFWVSLRKRKFICTRLLILTQGSPRVSGLSPSSLTLRFVFVGYRVPYRPDLWSYLIVGEIVYQHYLELWGYPIHPTCLIGYPGLYNARLISSGTPCVKALHCPPRNSKSIPGFLRVKGFVNWRSKVLPYKGFPCGGSLVESSWIYICQDR